MSEYFASVWGPDWVYHLIIIALLALLLQVVKDVLRHWRAWRGFWILRKVSSTRLQSARRLLYIANVNAYVRGKVNEAVSRDVAGRSDHDSD